MDPYRTARRLGAPALLIAVALLALAASGHPVRSVEVRDAALSPEAAPATVPGQKVRCRVMRGLDTPFPGGKVRLDLFAGTETVGNPIFQAEMTADALGFAEAQLPRSRFVCIAQFVAAAEGFHTEAVTTYVIPGALGLLTPTVYLFPMDRSVRGRVTDETGQPIAGARIHAFLNGLQTSDAKGEFELRGSSSHPRLRYTIWAPGFGLVSDRVWVGGGGGSSLGVQLARAGKIRGRVTDSAGQPVGGVTVTTSVHQLLGVEATTDKSGGYTLDAGGPGQAVHRVSAHLAGVGAGGVPVRGTGEGAAANIQLQPQVTAECTVVDANEVPIPFAVVSSEALRLRRLTGPDGKVVIAGIAPGSYAVQVHRPGIGRLLRDMRVPARALSVKFRWTLFPGKALAGKITDESGHPLPHIEVRAQDRRGRLFGATAVSGRDGRYRLSDLPGQVRSVQVRGMGFAEIAGARVRLGDLAKNFELERSVHLHGHVVVDDTGLPIRKFRIRVLYPNRGVRAAWLRSGLSFDDAGGHWRTERENIRAGTEFLLEARAPGFAPCLVRNVVAKKGGDPIEFRLHRGFSMKVRVMDRATGRAATNVEVELAHPPGRPVGDARYPGAHRVIAVDAEGVAKFVDLSLEAGVTMLLRRRGKLIQVGKKIDLAPGGAPEIVWLEAPATLRGSIVSGKGIPLSRARIVLSRIDGRAVDRRSARRDLVAGADGSFEFPNLIPARYELHASAVVEPGTLAVFQESLTVTGKKIPPLSLSPGRFCQLKATISLPPGAEGARATLSRIAKGARFHQVPFPKDHFAFLGLVPGQYRLSVSYRVGRKFESHTEPNPIELHRGRPVKVHIDVKKPR